jgi:hypothetical protein
MAFGFGIPGSFSTVSTVSSVLDNHWHHVAGVFTGTQIQIYLDGLLSGSVAQSSPPVNNSRDVEIGSSFGGGSRQRYFNGLLDDLRYYNRALTSNEILAIYQAATNGMCLPTPLMFTGAPSYNKTNGIVLSVSLRSGQSYHLQANTNLVSTNWINLTNVTAGTAPISHFTDQPPMNARQRFYRIVSP